MDAELHALIRGAATLPHSGRTLRDHLVGTWDLLRRWDAPAVVRRAGLVHSIYATSEFPHALVAATDRERVRQVAGVDAERLAWIFCGLDRSRLFDAIYGTRARRLQPVHALVHGEGMVLDEHTLAALLVIEMANYAEQAGAEAGAGPVAWMFWIVGWRVLEHLPFPLPPATRLGLGGLGWEREERACAAYLHGDFALACEENPYAAEPLLRHAQELELTGARDDARSKARAARQLLEAWQCAWDKRRTWRQWAALAARLSGGDASSKLRAEIA